jgi:hypothetical protein
VMPRCDRPLPRAWQTTGVLGSDVLRSGYGDVFEVSDVEMDADRDVTSTRNGLLRCEGFR